MLNHLPNSILLLWETAIDIAFMAYLFIRAEEFSWIFGSISLTAFFRQANFPCIHVDVARIAAITATASIFAVDDDLRSQR
jgi:hypothetical protein